MEAVIILDNERLIEIVTEYIGKYERGDVVEVELIPPSQAQADSGVTEVEARVTVQLPELAQEPKAAGVINSGVVDLLNGVSTQLRKWANEDAAMKPGDSRPTRVEAQRQLAGRINNYLGGG